MTLFTSQSAAAFYDKLFSSLDFTLPKAATGRRGFPKEAMVYMLSWNGESFGTSEKVSKAAREKVDSDILISTIMSTVINPLFGFIGHV